jgi:hypothetical protein
VLLNLLHAGLLSLFAAFAVDLGFSVAFVDDTVAYMATLYSTLLVAFLVGRKGEHWSRRVVWRLPFVVAVSVFVVVSLRTWALFALPVGDGWQSGHSPYCVLPCSALLLTTLLELLARFVKSQPATTATIKPSVQASAE